MTTLEPKTTETLAQYLVRCRDTAIGSGGAVRACYERTTFVVHARMSAADLAEAWVDARRLTHAAVVKSSADPGV